MKDLNAFNKFKEGGGGWVLLFFRIHVKGVIEFFCDAGGGTGHFV
jgi:hypothetical protein